MTRVNAAIDDFHKVMDDPNQTLKELYTAKKTFFGNLGEDVKEVAYLNGTLVRVL